MIEVSKDMVFHISSFNTSYLFRVNREGYLEHLYYGKKLNINDKTLRLIKEKHLSRPGIDPSCSENHKNACLNQMSLEYSTEGHGDYKTPALRLEGGRKVDLKFKDFKAYPGIRRFKYSNLPQAIQTERASSSVDVVLYDEREKLEVTLIYTVFENLDAIVRKVLIRNLDKMDKRLEAAASLQLDLPMPDYELISLKGGYARERSLQREKLARGTRIIESRRLNSSHEENPAFALVSSRGEAIFSSLIYSGAHRESFSSTEYGKTHVVSGINPDMFSWHLEALEGAFETPEAVLVYSEQGLEDASIRFKYFIENAVYRGMWKDRLRPVMLSSFADENYNINEDKLHPLVKNAKKLGFEGILVDDGWFATRKNRNTSLGDWYVNPLKFPSGLRALGSEIHREGLMFGLYFELEEVSLKSNLIEKHPDWVLRDPKRSNYSTFHSEFLLDLTRKEVQTWVEDTLSQIIETVKLDYIKWDMRRLYSDIYLNGTECYDYGEFPHRYMMGLYKILNTIVRKYPNLYLECAAAGGGRFDLGMLSYASTMSLSENYDAFSRLDNLEGTYLFYPQSAIKLRIAPNPSRFTGRAVELETRFNTSLFSCLEYSLDINRLKEDDLVALQQQIAFYLQYRQFLQYSRLRVLRNDRYIYLLEAANMDSSTIMYTYAQKESEVNTYSERLYVESANPAYQYRVFARTHVQSEFMNSVYPQELECYENCDGDVLKWAGISLSNKDTLNRFTDDMRRLVDFSSRLYIIKKQEA